MVRLCSVERDVVTLEVRVDISGAMLDAEERIGEALNEAGMVATQEALKRFDTDGAAVVTESTCKTLVKHRLCASGTRWKERGAGIVLSLSALVLTDQRQGERTIFLSC